MLTTALEADASAMAKAAGQDAGTKVRILLVMLVSFTSEFEDQSPILRYQDTAILIHLQPVSSATCDP